MAAVASAASAAAAWRTTVKTTKAAETAEVALAQVLRPAFSVKLGGVGPAKENHLALRLSNTSAYDAIDISITVHDSQFRELQERTVPRMRGVQPNVLGSAQVETLFIPRHLELKDVGDSYTVRLTVRYSDERGLRRWEQEIRYNWSLSEGRELKKQTHLGTPHPYPYSRDKVV